MTAPKLTEAQRGWLRVMADPRWITGISGIPKRTLECLLRAGLIAKSPVIMFRDAYCLTEAGRRAVGK
jgi:hypothetical protein